MRTAPHLSKLVLGLGLALGAMPPPPACGDNCPLPVAGCVLLKHKIYNQTNSNGPFPAVDATHGFALFAQSSVPGVIALTNGKLLSFQTNIDLFPDGGDPDSFSWDQGFPSRSALDAAFPSTNYTLSFDYSSDLLGISGTGGSTIPLLGDGYPNAPAILNFASMQAAPANRDFTLQFNPFTNAAPSDRVTFAYFPLGKDAGGETISVPPTATSLTIPGDKLAAGSNMVCTLFFQHVTASDDSLASCINYNAMFGSDTSFYLRVSDGTQPVLTLDARPPGAGIRFHFNTKPGQTYRVMVSTNLPVWNPNAVLTTNAAGNSVSFVETNNAGAPRRFFRVVSP